MRRIGDMAADAVCQAAVGFKSHDSADHTIAAFNAHIAPIAKLYDFQLQMDPSDGGLVLRGDIDKATCVLLYLCRESRTPAIDWLLDTVTWFQTSQATFDWKKAWNKIRHTKRGKWWRKERDKQINASSKMFKLEAPTLGPKINEPPIRTPETLYRGRYWPDKHEMGVPVTSPRAVVPPDDMD